MIAKLNIQYLTDEDGNKTAVIIPINDWINITSNLSEFLEYQSFKGKITSAFKEVVDLKKNKGSKVSLNEFLDDL